MHAPGIFERLFSVPHVGAKGVGRLTIDPPMTKPVACQFVAVGHDAPHQSRVSLGNPTQHEECCLNFGLSENIEQT